MAAWSIIRAPMPSGGGCNTPHLLVATCAAAAAGCTLLLALSVDGMAGAIPLRFLTGVFLAGVYPVGMKLMASWSDRSGRGRALGILIGALTLGSALPHLIGGLGPLPWPACWSPRPGSPCSGRWSP